MRPLFTKDQSGKLIRNYYCLECSDGPFLQADIENHVLIETGYGHQKAYYCRTCCNRKLPNLIFPAIGEIVKYIPNIPSKYVKKAQEKEREADRVVKFTVPRKPIFAPTLRNQGPVAVLEQSISPMRSSKIIFEQKAHQKEDIILANLSGPEIINLVKNKTGIYIPISPKSKKSILKHAKSIFEKFGFKIHF